MKQPTDLVSLSCLSLGICAGSFVSLGLKAGAGERSLICDCGRTRKGAEAKR